MEKEKKSSSPETVLETEGLQVLFHGEESTVEAVSSVSLQIKAGEVLGIAGESGSGKSTLCLAIMNLLPEGIGEIAGGIVRLKGENLTAMTQRQLESVRGKDMSMIFQEPMSSLNPLMTVGKQISNVIRLHNPKMSRAEIDARTLELVKKVGIPDAEKRIHDYPHLLSGGMRQRVMIAMALANSPKLLLCDEPTTALDVTIQAQVLKLIRDLSKEKNSAVIFVTHDMGVIAQIADTVAVMYSGQVVEKAPVKELFEHPLHPYTKGLLESIPSRNRHADRLKCIPGTVGRRTPDQIGCAFAPRCSFASAECQGKNPPEKEESGHFVRCFLQGGSL